MPTDTKNTEGAENVSSSPESFLKSSWVNDQANLYGDFFQETSDGNITIGTKSQKSWLEVATGILSYVVPIAVVVTILASIHVFMRTQESGSFAENYQFLCPYINMGVNAPEKWCKTFTAIEKEYNDKTKSLEESTIELLTEYIPIKVSKNIMDASPERRLVFTVFEEKVHVDDIIRDFETIRKTASYVGWNNIECNGLSITNGNMLSTQCTVYGGAIGDDDANKKLWSARIEALRFVDTLSNTPKSRFILMNPPSSLTVEDITSGTDFGVSTAFKTRTTLQIQVRYVPFNQKS